MQSLVKSAIGFLLVLMASSIGFGQGRFNALEGEQPPYVQPLYTHPGVSDVGGYNPAYVRSSAWGPADALAAAGASANLEQAIQKLETIRADTDSIEQERAVRDALELMQNAARGTVGAAEKAVIEARLEAANQAAADPAGSSGLEINENIKHQPLINIKVRVIEVQRTDSLAVSSILDFITSSRDGALFGDSPFKEQSINDAKRRLSGVTRLPVAGLTGTDGIGSGLLVNLTLSNIDYLVTMLATEVNADTITAPQVTTTNGKKVEFRAGSYVPFALGRNTIVNNVNTTEQVFYRHVGSYICVTPQIVNWGNNHEGLGKVPGTYASVPDEFRFVVEDEITSEEVQPGIHGLFASSHVNILSPAVRAKLLEFHEKPAINSPRLEQARTALLNAYNELITAGISRSVLSEYVGSALDVPNISRHVSDGGNCAHCNWRPSECTINLNLSVRVSDPNLTPVNPGNTDSVVPVFAQSEQNVRAITNDIQIKSGRGAVLGGLITMRDVNAQQKIPVLGDIPIVGSLFRSTESSRIKTETLIFVEAEVLPSFENCVDECGRGLVEAKTSQDFQNSRIHTLGDVTDSPLNYGMHRAGLAGEYLPRPTSGESEYWHYYHTTQRQLRNHRLTNHVRDIAR